MGRKEEILYATLELAAENGMKGVSMSQIVFPLFCSFPLYFSFLYHSITYIH